MVAMTRDGAAVGRAGRLVALAATFSLLVIAGCEAAPVTTVDGSTPSPGSGTSSTTSSSSPSTATQTDTAWGRIWDRVPEAFPTFVGATPADAIDSEPVSARFVVDGAGAREIIGWMQMQLERATFATEALNGPQEDGGYVLDSTGPGECRIQVTAAPLGALASVQVRYGAGCPEPG
jgi:hypothetical protein